MSQVERRKVVIVGGGFAGLNAAKRLAGRKDFQVTLIDQKNHHLFQPLLYQVATAALNPADIALPIRSIFSRFRNIEVLMGSVESVDPHNKLVRADIGEIPYDSLILACGATHSYFGHDEWEIHAPGLKSLEEATEYRRRILTAFEQAETTRDKALQKQLLTFVVVGGGPTGVEMAGALGEISRYTFNRDFRRIDPKRTRVILVEAGPRILPAFDEELSERASRDLENLGVTIWTDSIVTNIDEEGVTIGSESIKASNVFWAAGVGAPGVNRTLSTPLDRLGRLIVEPDLSIKEYHDIFVVGDQANFSHTQDGQPLPGIAPVALQQGKWVAENLIREYRGKERQPFRYLDKGIMATIGRERAVVQTAGLKFTGFIAWVAWLVIHIMYLIGFKNRFIVGIQWFWSYLTLRRGARLITARTCKVPRKPSEILAMVRRAQEYEAAHASQKDGIEKKTGRKKSSGGSSRKKSTGKTAGKKKTPSRKK